MRNTGILTTPAPAGGVGLESDKFSKEAKSRQAYAEVMKKEKAENRYNKKVVSNITGLKDEEEITAFMKFCPLNVKFILESTDYELYLAVRNCYVEYAQVEMTADTIH